MLGDQGENRKLKFSNFHTKSYKNVILLKKSLNHKKIIELFVNEVCVPGLVYPPLRMAWPPGTVRRTEFVPTWSENCGSHTVWWGKVKRCGGWF